MLSPERQSAQMSKITNDGLTRSAWHRMLYVCTHMATVGVKWITYMYRCNEMMVTDDCAAICSKFIECQRHTWQSHL